MDLRDIITTAAATATAKGFDLTQHLTIVTQIGTEAAEAMEHISRSQNEKIDYVAKHSLGLHGYLSEYRSSATEHVDKSRVLDVDNMLEELADGMLRTCSYVGGNGWEDKFVDIICRKMEFNKDRPPLHGKAF